MGSWGGEDLWQGGGWRTRRPRWQLADQQSHIPMQTNQEEQLGSKTDCTNPGFQHGEIKPQNLWLWKPVGIAAVGETPSLTGEFIGETHRVLEGTQTHPPGNQHQKDLICLWVVGEVTECWRKPSKWHCSLSDPSPTYSTTMQQSGLPCPDEYLRFHPLQCSRYDKTKNYDPNERTDQSSKNRTKQRGVANL